MFANSAPVVSSQRAPHARLGEIVLRHMETTYRREPGAVCRAAFARVLPRLAAAPFVLDAGCGTGEGTFALARRFADRTVLGVDKSAVRLATGFRRCAAGQAPANAVLLHCELVDFWQLAAAARLRCTHQYLLYPNPWPKPEHLKRRWHAHPVFPTLLALGGALELRTNWRVYADEFRAALTIANIGSRCQALAPAEPLTPFERKYAASGHRLWRCVST
ncbi:MAG TPA: methyltransferase domain-containing protein [Rudaea sp.]|nr:methyltransferase domain-containing protein [Rudaea sp.]